MGVGLSVSDAEMTALKEAYAALDYRLSDAEMQNLAYFLHEAGIKGDLEAIRAKVESWTKRKKDLMKPRHIEKAYSRLKQQGRVSA